MTYNLTNLTGTATPLSLMNGINEISNGQFYLGMLITLYIIIIMATIRNGSIPSFTSATFITSILGVILTLAGGINPTLLPYFIIGIGIAIGSAFIASRKD